MFVGFCCCGVGKDFNKPSRFSIVVDTAIGRRILGLVPALVEILSLLQVELSALGATRLVGTRL